MNSAPLLVGCRLPVPPKHEAGDRRNVEAPVHHATERDLPLRESAVGLVPEDGDDFVPDTLDERGCRIVGYGSPRPCDPRP